MTFARGKEYLATTRVLWYASTVRAGPLGSSVGRGGAGSAMRFGSRVWATVAVLLGSCVAAVNVEAAVPTGSSLLPQAVSGIHVGIPFDYCYSSSGGECGSQYTGNLSSLIGKV